MQENSLFETLVDSMGDAVIAVDAAGKIVVWNPAAEALYGWTAQEVLGKHVESILKTVILEPADTRARTYTQIKHEGSWTGKVSQKCKDGSKVIVESTVRPYQMARPDHFGVVSINRDISEREKLRNRINRLEYLNRVLLRFPSLDEVFETYVSQIQEILNIGRVELWQYDPLSKQVSVLKIFSKKGSVLKIGQTSLLRDTVFAVVHVTRQPLVVRDLQDQFSRMQRKLLQPEDRALMVLPILQDVDVMGSLVFTHPEPGMFTLEDANLLAPTTEQLSLALKQIRMMESLREQIEENGKLLLASQENARQLQEVSKNLIRLQERERENLAREFHDEIGQSLTAVLLNLRSILSDYGHIQPDVTASIQESIDITSRLMDQVRSISLDLHPKVLEDLGFIPALRWLLNRSAKLLNGEVHFSAPPEYKPMEKEWEFEVFRIVQESLTNVLRHAKAQNIWLSLVQDSQTTVLKIKDDGIGFEGEYESAAQLPPNTFGLSSMFARASLIGCRLRIQSAPGKGTMVEIECSLENRPD